MRIRSTLPYALPALYTLVAISPGFAEPIELGDGIDGDEVQLHEPASDPRGFTSDDGELVVLIHDDSGLEGVLVRPGKQRAYRYRLGTGDTLTFAPHEKGIETLSRQVKDKVWSPTSPIIDDDSRHLGAGGNDGPQADYEDGRLYWVGPDGTAAGELELRVADASLEVWQVPSDGGLVLVHSASGYDPKKADSELDEPLTMAMSAYVPEPLTAQGARDLEEIACVAGALCPSGLLTASLLAEACAGTASELHAFEAYLAWHRGALEKHDITALVNVAAAIEGYPFSNARVKTFFYVDGDPEKGAASHLPQTCREAVASGRERTDAEADAASAFVRLRQLRKLK